MKLFESSIECESYSEIECNLLTRVLFMDIQEIILYKITLQPIPLVLGKGDVFNNEFVSIICWPNLL